jgi:hypothetical protein
MRLLKPGMRSVTASPFTAISLIRVRSGPLI